MIKDFENIYVVSVSETLILDGFPLPYPVCRTFQLFEISFGALSYKHCQWCANEDQGVLRLFVALSPFGKNGLN